MAGMPWGQSEIGAQVGARFSRWTKQVLPQNLLPDECVSLGQTRGAPIAWSSAAD